MLVTGAGGFIGGRVVEVFFQSDREVLAGVHRWENAVRIGRFPVEIERIDVMDRDTLRPALKRVDHVVHCAYGGGDVTREGTRNVLELAKKEGIHRVVHLSTTDVYGNVSGSVDEEQTLRKTGSEYVDSKVDAERICREYRDRGLSVVVLRPTIVYGPFGKDWSIGLARKLREGPLGGDRTFDGTVRPVYVDDVVGAITRALEVSGAGGKAFNVGGPRCMSWGEYLRAFREAMDLEPGEGGFGSPSLDSYLVTPLRMVGSYLMDNYPDLLRRMTASSSLLKSLARRARESIQTTPSLQELALFGRRADYVIEKARIVLGYSPRFELSRGLSLTADWLRHHRYLD